MTEVVQKTALILATVISCLHIGFLVLKAVLSYRIERDKLSKTQSEEESFRKSQRAALEHKRKIELLQKFEEFSKPYRKDENKISELDKLATLFEKVFSQEIDQD